MSRVDYDNQDAWKEAFFDDHDRSTPGPDQQPGWQLTAIGVVVGVMALVMLSV